MTHLVDVHQLRARGGEGFLNVTQDFAAIGVWTHWAGGLDVRLRVCSNLVHLLVSNRDPHPDDLAGWRASTGHGVEYRVADGQVVPIALPPAVPAPALDVWDHLAMARLS